MKELAVFFQLLLFCGLVTAQSFSDFSNNLSESHVYGGTSPMGGGVTFVDFNKDGCDDLTLTSDEGLDMFFYLGDCDGHFNRVELSGISYTGLSKHALWLDVDNDGDYDLFIGANDTGNKFFLNNGDLDFVDFTEDSGIDPTVDNNTIGCVSADFNNDGFLDIYVSNRTIGGFYTPVSNIMYYGNGDGTFEDVSISSNTQDDYEAPLCPVVLDYDRDGFQDIYIAQDKNFGNTMLHNIDGDVFESVAEETGTYFVMNGMNGEVVDINNDSYNDIYVTNSFYGNKFYINNGNGTFSEESEERGIAMYDEFCWGGIFCDIDNDTDLDLYVCAAYLQAPRKDYFFINDGNGYFQEATDEYGFQDNLDRSYGNMFSDTNGDGYPELFVNNYDTESQYYLNSGGTNNWLKYSFEGTASNRDGIGSMIHFFIDGEPHVRSSQCGQGWLSQESYEKVFGMGEAVQVDSALVEWPSGHTDWYYDLLASETYDFVEGDTYNASIISSNGNLICSGEETILQIDGEYESIVWNGSFEQEYFIVNSSETVTVEVTNEFGVTVLIEYPVSLANESLSLEIISGMAVCPGEFLSDVTIEVESDYPYEIFWDDVSGESYATLGLGDHVITIVDSVGCQNIHDFEITQSEDLSVSAIIDQPLCFGDLGQIVIDILGDGPFEIAMNGEDVGVFNPDLASGEYEIVVEDSNGCSEYAVYSIDELQELTYSVETSPDFGNDEGTITVAIDGGTPPYMLNGNSELFLEGLEEGTYDLEICDSNDCCWEFTTDIEFSVGIEGVLKTDFEIFPNPAEDFVTLKGDHVLHQDVFVYDALGRRVGFEFVNTSSTKVTINVSGLSSGMYVLKHKFDSFRFEIRR